ncbi:MAG: hypothetical protein IPH30_10710 [Betaproteobacteria bacterium]|nr:hypothetical protein [Betaproteobacteria bacterium]
MASNAGTRSVRGETRVSDTSRPPISLSCGPVTWSSITSSRPLPGGAWRRYCTVVPKRIAISACSPLAFTSSRSMICARAAGAAMRIAVSASAGKIAARRPGGRDRGAPCAALGHCGI